MRAKIDELNAMASVSIAPIFSGDGYGYGGGAVLVIGRFAIPFGEHPEAAKIATEVARRWNAALEPGEELDGEDFPG